MIVLERRGRSGVAILLYMETPGYCVNSYRLASLSKLTIDILLILTSKFLGRLR